MNWGLEGGGGGSTCFLKASYWLRHRIVNGSRLEMSICAYSHFIQVCYNIFEDCLIQYSHLLG